MHHVLRAKDMRMETAYTGSGRAIRRCSLVDAAAGSVHMGLGLCELDGGGHIDTHVHSFEESFYVLEGEPVLILDGVAYLLVAGACGVIPVGIKHAWLGPAKKNAIQIEQL